jgi:hypothetical protein
MGDRRYLRHFRIGVALLLIALAVPVLSGAVTSPTSVNEASLDGTGDVTVVTIDALGPSQIVAYGPDGDVVYQNKSYQIYHDVDPSPAGEWTVTYVASNGQLDPDRCAGDSECMLNVIERVNLSTGNVTRLYTRYSKNTGSTQIHDVDRVNDSVFLVGDIIFPDGVYMVNTTTDEKIWEWNVSEDYDPDSGGRYPNDWTHLNDVAYLDDGRVMVNLRNQDQVVFLDPGEGLQEDWTLGEDYGPTDDHEILYEQHNPDYIPAERGGPAVVVADSENNRIVEYQRRDGQWERSWSWTDPELAWPRDADRLPNGNTLIVDSHGQRILEVNTTGAVVREQSFPNGGYDIERLSTGDESTGGYSMQALRGTGGPGNTTTVGQDCETPVGCLESALTGLTPSLLLHGLLFVLPDWVTPLGGAALLVQALVVVVWGGIEILVHRHRLLRAIR